MLPLALAFGVASGVVRSRDLTQNELEGVFSVPVLDFDSLPSLADIDPYSMPVGLIKLRGSFSIASANELTRVLAADIKDHNIIILDFSETTSVDDSAALAIEELVQSAIEDDTDCVVLGLSGDVGRILRSLEVFHRVPAGNFVDTLDEAKQLSKNLLHKRGADDEAWRGRMKGVARTRWCIFLCAFMSAQGSFKGETLLNKVV